MMIKHFIGIDHVVVMVRDLDAAAEAWRRAGFTLSPRGTHSAHLGSANYTIMLDPDYIELLAVIAPTERNARGRAFLARREGIDRIAFTATDAEAGVTALRARGLAATGPLDFGRPVALPGGGTTEARFRTLQWPADERPGDVGLFACQHLTRAAVWIPELTRHPNTATRLARVEILAADPPAAAAHMARLIDGAAVAEPDGAQRVASGDGRADMLFMDRKTLAARHPGVPLDGLPDEGSACLAIRVADLAAARRTAGAAIAGEGRITLPAAAGTGILVELAAA